MSLLQANLGHSVTRLDLVDTTALAIQPFSGFTRLIVGESFTGSKAL